jgi:hypothetical protein
VFDNFDEGPEDSDQFNEFYDSPVNLPMQTLEELICRKSKEEFIYEQVYK